MEEMADPGCQNHNSKKTTAALMNSESFPHQQINVQLSPSTSQDLELIFKFWTEDNELTSDSYTKYSYQKCDFCSNSDLMKTKY